MASLPLPAAQAGHGLMHTIKQNLSLENDAQGYPVFSLTGRATFCLAAVTESQVRNPVKNIRVHLLKLREQMFLRLKINIEESVREN